MKDKLDYQKNKQRKYDEAYLRMAIEWAELSNCERKKVGALIIKDRMIILKMKMVKQNGMYYTLKPMLFLK